MVRSRLTAAYIFILSGLLILLLRYGYLQISDHKQLLVKAVDNYSSIVATSPVRGGVIDREGVVLADNRVSYAVAILPRDAHNIESIFTVLQSQIEFSDFDRKKYYKQLHLAKNFDWVIIKDDLADKEVATLTAHHYLYPELNIFAHTKRYYPFNDLYAPSIGYVGRVSQIDKKKLTESGVIRNYLANDYIGKSGLEQQYEAMLRGYIGKKIIRTDAFGNEVGLISNQPATDGYTLQLTLDNRLQQKAYELLGNRKGAIVALNPETGGVLVFVSKPSYNANLFLDGISPDDWEDLQNDSNNPLLNRCVQGTYPPGSTFKPFLAAAALYKGVRTPEYRFHDIGYFTLPGSSHRFRNSGNEVLGTIGIVDAITHSSDAFFYKLGLDMGVDRMHETLSLFGLGQKTGIDLPQENSGLLPSRAWKAKRFAHDAYQRNWLPADSVTMGVGQGFNHYTPLQMAYATSILANDGTARHPHLLDKVLDKEGKLITTYVESASQIPIPQKDLDLIKLGMTRVMQSGTGAQVGRGAAYTMAGKTGTAQVVSLQQNSRRAKFSGSKYKDHSWFIAFAPVDHPKIAIAVIVENGGWGASAAGPIVRQIFDEYLVKSESTSQTSQVQYKHFQPQKIAKRSSGNDENSGGLEDQEEEDDDGSDSQ
jgi:penicillin-binding protein 2